MLQKTNNDLETAKLAKNAVMLMVIGLCTVGTALAWFFYMKNADVNTVNMVSISTLDSEIRVNSQQFGIEEVSFELPTIQEISGLGYVKDDQLQLWKPMKDPFTGTPLSDSNNHWRLEFGQEDASVPKELVPNKDFLEFMVTIRTNMEGTVYLSPESMVMPFDTKDKTRFSQFGCYLDSDGEMTDTPFSRDYISAATRVAISEIFTEEEDENTVEVEKLRLIWAPNKDQELRAPLDDLENPIETATTGWGFLNESDSEQDYFYYDGEKVVKLTDEQRNGVPIPLNDEDDTFLFCDSLSDRGTKVGTLVLKEDGKYYCFLRVRIWIEGTDREAKSALAGGHFKTKLVFGSLGKDINDTGV